MTKSAKNDEQKAAATAAAATVPLAESTSAGDAAAASEATNQGGEELKQSTDSKPPAEEKKVKARVLVDCEHGQPNAVVEIDAATVDALAGVVDADPAAVAYAESLSRR